MCPEKVYALYRSRVACHRLMKPLFVPLQGNDKQRSYDVGVLSSFFGPLPLQATLQEDHHKQEYASDDILPE